MNTRYARPGNPIGAPIIDQNLAAGPANARAKTRNSGRRRVTRRQTLVWVLRLGVLTVALAVWELGVIDEFYVSKPSKVLDALRLWQEQGILFSNVTITLQTTLYGFIFGAALGGVVGFLLGVSRLLSEVFKPFIVALNAIPRLALIPLFLLWFGLGMASKVVMVTVIVFFLVFMNTYNGVRSVDAELIDVLRLMRASRWQRHTKVTLPAAATWIIAGLQVSVPYALVGAVTGEILASNRGMGYLLQRSSAQFYTEGVFAAIIVMMLMSGAVMALVSLIERYSLGWQRSRRQP